MSGKGGFLHSPVGFPARFSGNKMLDSTVSTFKSHATFSSGSKYISKTGTLPTDATFEMYSNKFAADETTAGAYTSILKNTQTSNFVHIS